MGIHYFYTWLTHRYPQIKIPHDARNSPQIDYLYLDLNGIIHLCAKDESALFKDMLCGKKTEEIYISILNYTNYVIGQVKPRKGLMIAIDGVAPRAKMNNQRNRRFMSSKSQSQVNDFMVNTLKMSPGIVNFKNNSISPGTEFMVELNKTIRFMLQQKLHEDEGWKGLEVVFSGGDVPGEGEHKILNYIRQQRQSADFDLNSTHCIYGNDSDLVLLSLLTHIPNVVLLREEMQHGHRTVINSATKRTTDHKKMELIFINILREYFAIEFESVVAKAPQNLEHVIDDFVLFSFFIGNDFLHQVYCMNTKMGIFDQFIEVITRYYLKVGKFLTNKAKINWDSFYAVLAEFLPLQTKMIKTTIADFNSRLAELHKNSFYAQFREEVKLRKANTGDNTAEQTAKKPSLFAKNVFQPLVAEKQDAKGPTKRATKVEKDNLLIGLMKDLKLEDQEEVSEGGDTKMVMVGEIEQKLLEGGEGQLAKGDGPGQGRVDDQLQGEEVIDEDEPVGEESGSDTEDFLKPGEKAPMTIDDINQEEIVEVEEEGGLENEELQEELCEEESKRFVEEFKSQYQKLVTARDLMQSVLANLEDKEQGGGEVYYREYFGFTSNLPEEVSRICHNYLNGVDFVYKYYYSGCPSWSWFYRYHLSPLLPDLHSYLKRMFDNGQPVEFTYSSSVAVDPFVQLLYILPKESLSLLPQSLVDRVMSPDSPISRYFPVDFPIVPFDKHKDYTWLAIIEHISEDQMQQFLSQNDFSTFLSSEELFRNSKGRDFLFSYDQSTPVELVSPVSGFPPTKVNVVLSAITIDSEFTTLSDFIDYNSISKLPKTKFPTMVFSKRLRFNRTIIRNRFKYDLVLTCEALEEMLDKTIAIGKSWRANGNKQQHLFCSPIDQRKYIVKDIVWFDSTDQTNRFKSAVECSLNWLAAVGIKLPEQEFTKFKKRNPQVPLLTLQVPSFTSMSYPGSFGQNFSVETGLVNDYEYLFCVGTWGPSFPKLKEYPRGEMRTWFQNGQVCLYALTGDLVRLLEVKQGKVPEVVRYEVIKRNPTCRNLALTVPVEEMHLIDEKLIGQLGLNLEELKILWIVMDSIKVLCDHSSPTTLVLGDGFEIGLNFINFLNRKPDDWKMVPDMARVFFKYRKNGRLPVRKNSVQSNDCMFIWEDCLHKEVKYYNMYLTTRGLAAVREYFSENKTVIAFLKANAKSLMFFDPKARVFRYKTQFRAAQIFDDLVNEDINIHLFKVYSGVLKKSHSNLQLMPSLCFNYSMDFVQQQLANLNFGNKPFKMEPLVVPFLMKFCSYEDVVWPPFGVQPYYHEEGDRVAFVNSQHQAIKFGVCGTVIGVYKEFIEVLFDEPFIGGTHLFGRCPNFRGGVVRFFDLYNLSKWNNIIVEPEDNAKAKKKLWDGRFEIEGLAKLVSSKQKSIWKPRF
jgi:5'-3' exonuclease